MLSLLKKWKMLSLLKIIENAIFTENICSESKRENVIFTKKFKKWKILPLL